jgi:hypothetical protein
LATGLALTIASVCLSSQYSYLFSVLLAGEINNLLTNITGACILEVV